MRTKKDTTTKRVLTKKSFSRKVERVYLDNAAATPIDGSVLKVVMQAMKKFPGNPSALHREGQDARAVLEDARAKISMLLAAHPEEVVFTSGATEANNMAILGVVHAARVHGVDHPHVIISAIEHPSVLEIARTLEGSGVRVDRLPVNEQGLVDPRALRKLITKETVLVSVMYANNEIGAIEPIRDIAKEVRHARKANEGVYPYLHTDAAQAMNYLDMNVLRLGVDLMTLSAGKSYGPRGVGALFVKRNIRMAPLMHGGEHEARRRPGTESVALAVGFADAFMIAEKMKARESMRISKLRDFLAEKILMGVQKVSVNGDTTCALPNILNVSVEGVESEALVLYLDAAGIAVSGKSACKSSATGPSHVILAIGKAREGEAGSIRFSLGRETKREDVLRVAKEFQRIVPLLRIARAQSDHV